MTRLERKEAELEKLYQCRAVAVRNCNFLQIQKNQSKIDILEKEIAELRKSGSMRLSEVLREHPEDVKNRVYKHLLRISLAADFVNECAEQTKSVLKDIGLNDFSLRKDVEELCSLSQKLASLVIIPNQNVLTDMIVDNGTFVDMCLKHADAHLKRKLKL